MSSSRWFLAFVVVATLSGCRGGSAAPSSNSVVGQWMGTYAVTTCVTTGWSSCDAAVAEYAFERVGQRYSLQMQITQVGATVTGGIVLNGGPNIPVEGTSSDSTLTLGGHLLMNATKSDSQSVDVQWTGAVSDSHLTGTLTVTRHVEWGPANTQHPPGTSTYDYVASVTDAVRLSR
ncbi:MAG: hypothetical protein QM736_13050 [Vicinamibacterales bacterium]